MINRIIGEINVCMNNNCFLAAFSTALTIPDICGQAEYGEIYNKTTYPKGFVRKRYVTWFDEYIGKYEKSPTTQKEFEEDFPYMNGEVVWNLRNNALHSASFDIGKNLDIQEFELLVQHPDRSSLTCNMSGIKTHFGYNTETKEEVVQKVKVLRISVVDLINKICDCAKFYYEENKEKFRFIESKLVTISKEIKESFHIKEDLNYDEVFPLNESLTKNKWSGWYVR